MPRYDPLKPPDARVWLSLDESERLMLIRAYHQRAGITMPNESLHVALHATVETQAALGDELPVRAVLERLQREGLDRHEAMHAVAAMLAEHIQYLTGGGAEPDPDAPNPHQRYYDAVKALTAEKWRALAARGV